MISRTRAVNSMLFGSPVVVEDSQLVGTVFAVHDTQSILRLKGDGIDPQKWYRFADISGNDNDLFQLR